MTQSSLRLQLRAATFCHQTFVSRKLITFFTIELNGRIFFVTALTPRLAPDLPLDAFGDVFMHTWARGRVPSGFFGLMFGKKFSW